MVTLFAAAMFAHADWRAIELIPNDNQSDKAFEKAMQVNFAASPDGWTAPPGDQYATARIAGGAGRSGKAVKIEYSFIGKEKLEYVNAGKEITVETPGLYYCMWAKFEGEVGSLRLRVNDASGETHQLEFENSIVPGVWKFYAAKLKDASGPWGGDGNKKLDYPVKAYAIVYDRPRRGFTGTGSITIDELYIMKKRLEARPLFKAEVEGAAFGNVFSGTGALKVRLAATDTTGAVGANYRVIDIAEQVRGSGSVDLSKGPGVIDINPGASGIFITELESTLNGVPVASYTLRMSVNPAVDLKSVRDSFFGICTHYQSGQRPDYYPLDTMTQMAQAGIKYLRDEMCWSRVETNKGAVLFDQRYDNYINHAASLGIEPLIILDYGNKFYDEANFPVSPEALAGFANYCKALATRYKGKIRYYEIWNEWTGGCGMKGKDGKNRPGNTPENYSALLKVAYETVKAVDPNAYIIGLGGEHSEHHFNAIEGMFKAGALKYCDAVSVHPYRYPRSPEESDMVGEIMKIKDLVTKYGGKQNIWITEVGWPTHKGSRETTEAEQARMLVRSHVLMMATGVVEKLFWYDLMDDGIDRAYNENNFGIIRHPKFYCMPKPAYSAYAVMSSMLTGVTLKGKSALHGNAEAYEFKRGDGTVIVAWAPKTACTITIPAGRKAVDMMGNVISSDADVTLGTDPVYLVQK